MTLAVVVSDTSPIRALAHLGLVELLRDLFGDVLVPPAVETELRVSPAGLPVVDLGQFPFIRVQAPLDQAQVQQFLQSLDPGESQALALALEVQADAILMDEAAGRARLFPLSGGPCRSTPVSRRMSKPLSPMFGRPSGRHAMAA